MTVSDDPPEKEELRGGVQSVEVAMRVLRALCAGAGPRPLKDIAAAAGLAPSSAHRYLASLQRTGAVEQDAVTGRYDVGPLLVEMGLVALGRLDPVRIGTAVLPDLRDRLDETVLFAVWGNRGATIIRWEEAARPVTVNVRVGSVLPLLSSATGRVFLTWLPDAATATFAAAEGGTAEQVAAIRAHTRALGLGRVDGDLLPGVAALAAPVFGHTGALVAALTALGPQAAIDVTPDGACARTLRDAAARLSRRLGWDG